MHPNSLPALDAAATLEASAQPVFYYDFSSPECYLAAERVVEALGRVPEWQPVRGAALPGGGPPTFRCAEEQDVYRLEIERAAAERGLQPMCWPAGWPADYELALRVAAYAKSIGRVVAFSLAALRQAYAAGRDLATVDGVTIAAAACEMHPAAVLKATERRSLGDELTRATAAAARAGVRGLPAVRVGEQILHGDGGLDAAAALLGESDPS